MYKPCNSQGSISLDIARLLKLGQRKDCILHKPCKSQVSISLDTAEDCISLAICSQGSISLDTARTAYCISLAKVRAA